MSVFFKKLPHCPGDPFREGGIAVTGLQSRHPLGIWHLRNL